MKAKTIYWIDAAACRNEGTEWYDKELALKIGKEKYETKTITTGFILEKNKNYLIVASTWSDDQFSDITMIPRKMIIKII